MYYLLQASGLLKGLLLSGVAVTLPVTVNARHERLFFPAKKMPAEKDIDEMEKQTKFSFIYNGNVFPAGSYVALDSYETSLRAALDKMSDDRGVGCFFRNNDIIISRNNKTAIPTAVAITNTGDGYKRNDPNAIDELYGSKGCGPVREQMRYDTIIKLGKVLPYPEPFSDYTSLRNYPDCPRKSPVIAIKTNLLYIATTFTPNIALKFGAGRRSTIEISGSYNWQGRKNKASAKDKQRVRMILRPEYRYWLCGRFEGHCFGGHALYFRYNINGINMPVSFEKEQRYDGDAYGAGLTYGYRRVFVNGGERILMRARGICA